MKARSIAELVGILGLVIVGGMLLTLDKGYKCDATGLAMNCDSLSKYYGLPNGKCNNAEYGNKLCRSGWDPLSELIEGQEVKMVTPEIEMVGDYTTSPDGKTCYIKGDLRRGVPCEI